MKRILQMETQDEIARITGLSHANVAVKLMRIREKINGKTGQPATCAQPCRNCTNLKRNKI